MHASKAPLALAALCAILICLPMCAVAQDDELPLDKISLPSGFGISVYARVPKARSLALGKAGTVFVGTREDAVYAVTDHDGDHKADTVFTIGQGLTQPNGVAYRDGALYVAEIGRVLRYDDIEARLEDPPSPVVVNDTFPEDEWHGWKYIAFGPDGWLYVPVGAPCNVCERPDPYASIMRMRPDGSGLEIYARGIRNTVGFDFHPRTGEMWFTGNGRDWAGDTKPPDTLNRAAKPGLHYGFPICMAHEIPKQPGAKGKCAKFEPPKLEIPAHSAPLGMKFYTGQMFPAQYRGQVFMAEHGSWNRTEPVGYRVTMAKLKGDVVVDYAVFASGWLEADGSKWGRPVDVLVMPDGALLVSDDHAGAIYRIAFQGTALAGKK
ncbi:MAG: PQQ-dependent sugar dehydrogenase [Desulfocurvibacter africanus]